VLVCGVMCAGCTQGALKKKEKKSTYLPAYLFGDFLDISSFIFDKWVGRYFFFAPFPFFCLFWGFVAFLCVSQQGEFKNTTTTFGGKSMSKAFGRKS
jgi:hypothetical protein